MFRLYEYRLGLMLTEDDPLYPNWDQDETAVADNYASQDPAVVADELVVAADSLADRFAAVSGDEWPAPAAAATARRSPWKRSPATSSTTPSTTSTT